MKRKTKSNDTRKLMDTITAGGEFGACLGFWDTTFDLDSEFFECDFLPTLLGLGAWDDRDWASRIAIQRELGKMDAATVMMDASRYRARPRSLFIETLPAKGTNGNALHAKVLLVLYEHAVRLFVGSANLTTPGYRQNIESMAVITVTPELPGSARLIRQALADAPTMLAPWWRKGADDLTQKADDWLAALPATDGEQEEAFAWSGGATPLWRQFLAKWPRGEKVEQITIASPFWSEEDGPGPIGVLLGKLRERSALQPAARVLLVTDVSPSASAPIRPALPASFGRFDFRTLGVRCSARAADPDVPRDELPTEEHIGSRRLHAKVVLFKGQSTSLAYLGSANFTAHGWGFLPEPSLANVEAGIILRRTGLGQGELDSLIPRTAGEEVELSGSSAALIAKPEPLPPTAPWPGFIREVRLCPHEGKGSRLDLTVVVSPEKVDGPWSLWLLQKEGIAQQTLVTENQSAGHHRFIRVPLEERLIDRLLIDQEVEAHWRGENSSRYPVNVDDAARNGLSVCPGSGRPGEERLIEYYQGKIRWEDLFPPMEQEAPVGSGAGDGENVPPEVDTSRIQAYQIREFVEALDGIRDDLKNASASARSMRHALLGPVSPVALAREVADRVRAGKRTATAGAFQLVEILACLEEARNLQNNEAWEGDRAKAAKFVCGLLQQLKQDNRRKLGGQFNDYEKRVLHYYRSKGVKA